MVRRPEEVDAALDVVGGRCGLGILIETTDAVRRAEELVSRLVSRVYVGMNDLMIDRGRVCLFEALVDGTVDHVSSVAARAGVPFGVAGLTVPDEGRPDPLPAPRRRAGRRRRLVHLPPPVVPRRHRRPGPGRGGAPNPGGRHRGPPPPRRRGRRRPFRAGGDRGAAERRPGRMRALVTGAGGFVGAHLVARLVADGWDVVGTARPGSPPWRLGALGVDRSVEVVDADLASRQATGEVARAADPDVVFLLAAVPVVGHRRRQGHRRRGQRVQRRVAGRGRRRPVPGGDPAGLVDRVRESVRPDGRAHAGAAEGVLRRHQGRRLAPRGRCRRPAGPAVRSPARLPGLRAARPPRSAGAQRPAGGSARRDPAPHPARACVATGCSWTTWSRRASGPRPPTGWQPGRCSTSAPGGRWRTSSWWPRSSG